MTFEEWYSIHDAGCWILLKENGTKAALKEAWEAAFEEGYKFANKENEEYDKIGV